MDYIYEAINFNKALPVKILVHSVNHVQNHWHESIELLFILSGKVDVAVEGEKYELKEEDIILINSNEIHAIDSKYDNVILAFQIPVEVIKEHYESLKDIKFICKSFIYKNQEQDRFDVLRNVLAEMMWVYSKSEEGFELKLQSLLFNLIYTLVKDFKNVNSDDKRQKNSEKYLDRLSGIISHIKENYKGEISLNALAQKEYLSVAYLSKFFQKYMGMTFSDYVSSVRLEYAVKDLIYTDLSITQIALQNGFANEKSLFSSFKENYGDTPNHYRKKIKNNLKSFDKKSKDQRNYFEVDTQSVYRALFKYIKRDNNRQNEKQHVSKDLGEVDLTKQKEKIRHTWKSLTTIGKAKDGLLAEVQRHLTQLQKDVGFKYIRFHGIFDDEMMVYDEDREGNPVLNFTYIDRLFDFFYGIGLKPFIELGFMPSKLSKADKTIFYRKSIISMPKDMDKWKLLIKGFVNHCIDQYGEEEVRQWYFEVWNESNLVELFGFEKEEDYYELFENTYKTIKKASEHVKVGGPAAALIGDEDFHWLKRYMDFCARQGCDPDFITYHFYPHESNEGSVEHDYSLLNQGFSLAQNENILSQYIDKVKVVLSECGKSHIEQYITEWNSTAWHRDLANDTCYKAAYIVKNIVENMDSTAAIGYWTATDFIEEFQASSHTFHGGLGVITNNGIKKSGYYAFWLLNKLGNVVVNSGDGYYITASNRGYQIIFYNYCHFDKLYSMKDLSQISISDRYNIFKSNYNKEIKLMIKGFMEGTYEIKKYAVNREHGSAFDTWVEMGSIKYLNVEEIRYLDNKSVPSFSKKEELIEDRYLLSESLSPHEVILYEFNIKQNHI